MFKAENIRKLTQLFLVMFLLGFVVFTPFVNAEKLAGVTLSAGTPVAGGLLNFEHNPGGTFGPATMTYGNLDPAHPSRDVWRMTAASQFNGVFILLNGLSIPAGVDELVFDVRGAVGNERFLLKMESGAPPQNGPAPCQSERASQTFFTISNNYQQVRIPLSSFSSACCGASCALNLTYLHAWTVISNQASALTLFFDNLRFE